MHDLEHRVSLVWVVDSYWRTISTTHMGLSAGLVRGDRQSHGVLMAAGSNVLRAAGIPPLVGRCARSGRSDASEGGRGGWSVDGHQ